MIMPHHWWPVFKVLYFPLGLPQWLSGKESASQCRRRRRFWFDPWVRKIPLEKEVATHSSILAWRIPWTEGPGGLQPSGLQRVGHDWYTTHACVFSFENTNYY